MRRSAAAIAALVALLAASGCGGEAKPEFRIGVILDCVGAFRGLHDQELAGASLPLLERGAERGSSEDAGAPGPVTVAGRRVRLVTACSESGEFVALTQAARALVEREHASVVVDGGPFVVDALALRDVAARIGQAVYITGSTGPREATLQHPARSMYRVAADQTQAVAGLAAYAYHRLGWRTAALVTEDWVAGWQPELAFAREFCALGGRITRRTPLSSPTPSAATARRVMPGGTDGLVVLASPFFMNADLLRALARASGDPPRRLLLGPEIVADQTTVRETGAVLRGVVGASSVVPPSASADVRRYRRSFARWNRGPLADAALDPLVAGYRNAVEATLRALQRTGGDPGPGLDRLRVALGAMNTELLGAPVRLDSRRQAVTTTTLVRIARANGPGAPVLTRVQSDPGVDATLGGRVPAALVPSSAGPGRCRRTT